MSDTKITQTYIFNIARSKEVDKNQNGQLEGDEISIFEKKLEEKGITNPQIYVKSFNNSKKSIDADIITKEIDDAFAIWGWTWLDDLDKAIEKINSGNVLEVLESYDDGDSLIEQLDNELYFGQDRLTKYGNTIINSLLEVAKERHIDVSDIVTKNENNGYVVGPSVKDANSKELATDSDNLDLVVTALRNRIESYTSLYTIQQSAPELYCIPARQPGSAYQIRNTIVQTKGNADGTTGTVYELHPVRRWPVFVLLALLFLIAGFVSSEFNPLRFRKVASTGLMILLCCSSVLMQGCSGDWEGTISILSGTFNWHRGNYRESAADFLRTVEYAEQQQNPQLKQYGIYGLAVTYLMQGETAAADSRLQEISPDAPDEIRFAASYNAGIIAYRNGLYQEAAGYFRQALEIDNLNIDAKLNFELSRQQQTVQSSGGIQEMIPVSENNNEIGPEQMLFSLVREQEENRWKNKQSSDVSKSGADY